MECTLLFQLKTLKPRIFARTSRKEELFSQGLTELAARFNVFKTQVYSAPTSLPGSTLVPSFLASFHGEVTWMKVRGLSAAQKHPRTHPHTPPTNTHKKPMWAILRGYLHTSRNLLEKFQNKFYVIQFQVQFLLLHWECCYLSLRTFATLTIVVCMG